MKKILFIFLLLSLSITSCFNPSKLDEEKKLKNWQNDTSTTIKLMPFSSDSYEEKLDTFTFQNHLWLFYADYRRGSVTHHPDCKNPKCQK